MKKITGILSIILFIIVAISIIIVSSIAIWIEVDPLILEKIQSTILLLAIIMILSFVLNQSVEE